MKKFFGVLKLILCVIFLLLTIATFNYYLEFNGRKEVETVDLLKVRLTYVVSSYLYAIYSVCLGYSAIIDFKLNKTLPKVVAWIGIAIGLTFVVTTYLISTPSNIILAMFILLVSIRDLGFVNRK